MEAYVVLHLLLLVASAVSEQHQYKVVTDNVTVGYVNHNYIDLTASVVKVNEMPGIDLTITLRCDLPESAKMNIKAFKRLGNAYRIPTVQINKPLKDVLEMETFDLQSLWVHCAKPPVTWPVKKDVTYRIQGWIPDSTKFPSNLPNGNWKVTIILEFANNTKLVEGNWFFTIYYNK